MFIPHVWGSYMEGIPSFSWFPVCLFTPVMPFHIVSDSPVSLSSFLTLRWLYVTWNRTEGMDWATLGFRSKCLLGTPCGKRLSHHLPAWRGPISILLSPVVSSWHSLELDRFMNLSFRESLSSLKGGLHAFATPSDQSNQNHSVTGHLAMARRVTAPETPPHCESSFCCIDRWNWGSFCYAFVCA